MSGETERFLTSYGDVKTALDKVLNQAAQDAESPAEIHMVAQSYSDLRMSQSAMTLRTKIGNEIKARVDKPNTIKDIAYLAGALSLLD